MENKIEVGEYIRTTEDGIIGKVKRIELDEIDKSLKWYVFDKKRYDMNIIDEIYINKPYIKSHSFNIIDLIEEGDYVNGIKIYSVRKAIGYGNAGQEGILINKNFMNCKFIPNEDIKSIVTKEKFKSVEYEV